MRKNFNEFYKSNDYLKFQEFIHTQYGIELIVTEFSSHLIKKAANSKYEIEFDVNFDLDRAIECANITMLCEYMEFLIQNTPEASVQKAIPYGKAVRKTMFGVKKVTASFTYTKKPAKSYSFADAVHDMVLNTYREYPA